MLPAVVAAHLTHEDVRRGQQVKGGVILFRGPGTAARRYLEADRATADDYYLETGTALAEFTVIAASGEMVDARALTPDEYAGWVDWTNPLTGTSMGTPREPGQSKHGSPRFAEMVINTPKSLSVAAVLHPEVSDALDAAQQDAAAEIRRWLAQHSVTRAGPRGAQEVVPVEALQTVAVSHRTSRAGDPHRHIHFQIGTRVHAAGKWRALDTAALFKQQGAIRALGAAVIAAHPQLAVVLDRHGLTLDPVSGEVAELERFNAVMSKRARQVERSLDRLEAEWEATHPGETAGPVVRSRMLATAWAHERPSKKPTSLATEEAWRVELIDAGYKQEQIARVRPRRVTALDDLSIQEVANRALDRCAAGASTWTPHTIREHATRIMTEHGARATPTEVREFVALATRLATSDCFSVLPEGAARPEHVAHLTSVQVVQSETRLRDLLTAATLDHDLPRPDVADLPSAQGVDADQLQAAAAVASTDPLVVVEGAAGSGKTTMLRTAIDAAERDGRKTRVVAPTKKAAHVAGNELGVPAESVAALVHAHGWRWNNDGVWTRLTLGDSDPDSGRIYHGPPAEARLTAGERVVVDEAGMLDQDTAIALLTIATEAGATVALIGDRAQLSAVGRGGVLDIAAQIRGATLDITGLHRFTDPEYADLTLRLRNGENPAEAFDQLQAMGLVKLHDTTDTLQAHIAATSTTDNAVTVATNDEARELNAHIQAERLHRGEIDHTRTITGSDDLDIGAGDLIQARKNDSGLGIANRQTFTVQHKDDDGTLWAVDNGNDRKRQHTVRLPAEYVGEHAHLAYASTAYGVQGTTMIGSHTVLNDAMSAAGVYVGMTRGREQNVLHVVAKTADDARKQFVLSMERDRADRGLDAAAQTAHIEIHGLIEDGPITFVNTERARLTKAIDSAELQAEKWERAVELLERQAQEQRAEQEHRHAALTNAKLQASEIRSEVATPLIEEAHRDGTNYLTAITKTEQTITAHREAGRFKKRAAGRVRDSAVTVSDSARQQVRGRWGSTPSTGDMLSAWAQRAAIEQTESNPRVKDATRTLEDAQTAASSAVAQYMSDRSRLLEGIYRQVAPGRIPSGSVQTHRDWWRERATGLREELSDIEALAPEQAETHIRALQTAAETTERARAERQTRLEAPETDASRNGGPQHEHGISY